METNELFEQIISKRAWYKPLGWTRSHAFTIKTRYYAGTLTEGTIIKILEKLGFKKNVNWVEKVRK